MRRVGTSGGVPGMGGGGAGGGICCATASPAETRNAASANRRKTKDPNLMPEEAPPSMIGALRDCFETSLPPIDGLLRRPSRLGGARRCGSRTSLHRERLVQVDWIDRRCYSRRQLHPRTSPIHRLPQSHERRSRLQLF